jgi:hypothetical protein
MSPMAFPRYLERDRRDYFYLSLKPVLPGPSIQVDGARIEYSTTGLPHPGWPHAFARAQLPNTDGVKRWLVRIDTSRAVPQSLAKPSHVQALAYLSEVSATVGSVALLRKRTPGGTVSFHVGDPGSRNDGIVLRGELLRPDSAAVCAVGADAEGFLVYAEIERPVPGLLYRTLQQASVHEAVLLGPASRLAFVIGGKTVSVDGTSAVAVQPDGRRRPVPGNGAAPLSPVGLAAGQARSLLPARSRPAIP